VEVLLTIEEDILNLEVRDDGLGIEEEMVRRPSSLGILGMEERARRVHGTLTLEPCTEGGTLARVCIPLNPKGAV
jgi:signal transduction histidine kinase